MTELPTELSEGLEERLSQIENSISEASLKNCQEILSEYYNLETVKFLQFLEQTFENKSSASSLTNIAISAFGKYKQNLNNVFSSLAPKSTQFDSDIDFNVEFSNYSQCFELTDSYIDIAKENMIRHIKTNSNKKKSTILLEKYQAINEKINDLNFEIAELYGFFVTFKNKLPFFLKECL